jgi:dsDNA-binding SOS-regulon protein
LNNIQEISTAICKSLRGIGLSQQKEHAIENNIVKQLRSSGPDFVLNRMSELKDWRLKHMMGDTSYHPDWYRFRRRKGTCVPTDKIGAQLWQLNDRAFLAVVGAISSSVEYTEITEKQALKWISGVRCTNQSSDKRVLKRSLSTEALDKLESMLVSNWNNRKWFSVEDVTGSNIPGNSGKFMTVKFNKSDSTKEPLSLLRAYSFSMRSAPLFTWQFLKDIDAVDRIKVGNLKSQTEIGRLNESETRISLGKMIAKRMENETLHDLALGGDSFGFDEFMPETGRVKYYDTIFGFSTTVGNIGFLQQKKGKLRTVANPNRFVQWCNVPLGQVMSKYFYKADGCYVLDQEAGIHWAQEQLRKGTKLSSFDMSSATDMLDYQKFLQEYFHKMDATRHPLLQRSIDLFIDTSSSPWSIPGHIADVINADENKISWSVGQPLGLRPSFPLLTVMNMQFAREAILRVDGVITPGQFACVGDDMIINDKYADAYMQIVRDFNGSINNDKSVKSDRIAEFCSQLITKNTSFPLKPKYIQGIDGYLSNIQKFLSPESHPRVPKWAWELYYSISPYHLEGSRNLHYTHSPDALPVLDRVAADLMLNCAKTNPRDTERVSLETLYLRAVEKQDRVTKQHQALKTELEVLQQKKLEELREAHEAQEDRKLNFEPYPVKDLATSSSTMPFTSFGGDTSKVKQDVEYTTVHADFDITDISQIPDATATSVAVPVRTTWDYRENRYKDTGSSDLRKARELSRLLNKSTISSDDTGLTELSVVNKKNHEKLTVLLDTKSDKPEAIVEYANEHNSKASTIEIVDPGLIPEVEQLEPVGLADEQAEDEEFEL